MGWNNELYVCTVDDCKGGKSVDDTQVKIISTVISKIVLLYITYKSIYIKLDEIKINGAEMSWTMSW